MDLRRSRCKSTSDFSSGQGVYGTPVLYPTVGYIWRVDKQGLKKYLTTAYSALSRTSEFIHRNGHIADCYTLNIIYVNDLLEAV